MSASPYLGEIATFAFNFVPSGWAACHGQLLPIESHSALFSLIGTMYGGDGRSTFALPDMRGRVAIGQGDRSESNQSYSVGDRVGHETQHLYSRDVAVVESENNVRVVYASEQPPLSVMQPSLALNYCIALEGEYPNRT